MRALERLEEWRGLPKAIRMDNGPEFVSETLKQWAREREVELIYIQPGKPTQNALIERFKGSYRRAILDRYWFASVKHARQLTQRWAWRYNQERPHAGLKNATPDEVLRRYYKTKALLTYGPN